MRGSSLSKRRTRRWCESRFYPSDLVNVQRSADSDVAPALKKHSHDTRLTPPRTTDTQLDHFSFIFARSRAKRTSLVIKLVVRVKFSTHIDWSITQTQREREKEGEGKISGPILRRINCASIVFSAVPSSIIHFRWSIFSFSLSSKDLFERFASKDVIQSIGSRFVFIIFFFSSFENFILFFFSFFFSLFLVRGLFYRFSQAVWLIAKKLKHRGERYRRCLSGRRRNKSCVGLHVDSARLSRVSSFVRFVCVYRFHSVCRFVKGEEFGKVEETRRKGNFMRHVEGRGAFSWDDCLSFVDPRDRRVSGKWIFDSFGSVQRSLFSLIIFFNQSGTWNGQFDKRIVENLKRYLKLISMFAVNGTV